MEQDRFNEGTFPGGMTEGQIHDADVNFRGDEEKREAGMIEWTVSKEDMNLIIAITLRAEMMGIAGRAQRQGTLMDLTACHANGTPLRLPDLLHAADGDFIHDITGIRAHMDRDTGHLLDCFLPRYAAKGE